MPLTVLTGATNGLGLVTARDLARAGHRLVLLVRDPGKAAPIADELRTLGAPEVRVLVGDLARQADVRRLAEALLAQGEPIDVLVNNAGAIFDERVVTEDGLEKTFALNHMAYFLLTALLRPLLEAAPAARVINVASDAHRMGKLDLDDLQFAKGGFSAWAAYGRSKGCNILFTRELARRLAGTRVVTHCYHPGPVNTGFGSTMNGMMGQLLYPLVRRFMRSPEKGADCLTWLCTAPTLPGPSGSYWFDRALHPARAWAQDDVAAARLWEASEGLIRA